MADIRLQRYPNKGMLPTRSRINNQNATEPINFIVTRICQNYAITHDEMSTPLAPPSPTSISESPKARSTKLVMVRRNRAARNTTDGYPAIPTPETPTRHGTGQK